MKIYIISIMLIFSCFQADAQEEDWRILSFGPKCCNYYASVEEIFSIGNDVYLKVFHSNEPYTFFRSTDNGESWVQLFENYKDSIVSAMAEYRDGKVIVSRYDGNLKHSFFICDSPLDSMKYWKRIDKGFPDALMLGLSITVDTSGDIFAFTGLKVYFLAEGDSQWVDRNSGLPADIEINSVFPLSNGVVLLASINKGMFRSTNNGESWKAVDFKYKDRNVITFTKNNKGDIFTIINSRAFISKDYGSKWDSINNGLSSAGIWSIAAAANNDLYAFGRDTILYRSTDNGDSWYYFQKAPSLEGFGNYLGLFLIYINKPGYVFLTNSSDILSSTNIITSLSPDGNTSKVVPEYSLIQNYPNPFNPSTTLEYSIPVGSNVTIKVYNMLGQELSTLVKEFQPAGKHSISFDGVSLSSGVYIYKIESGDFQASKKMLLLK